MFTRFIKIILAIISISCLSQSPAPVDAATDQQQPASRYQIKAAKPDIGPNTVSLLLIGDSAPAYTVSERFDPYRLVVDIAEAEFNKELNLDQLLPPNDIAKLHLAILTEQKPSIARFEFALQENATYDVQRIDNNLHIKIFIQPTATPTANAVEAEGAGGETPATDTAKLFEAPNADIGSLISPEAKQADEIAQMQDNFAFSGYKSERISVDFYKIDLHNVFRLFREVSDMNIIVDETVNGSITIALSDVPWDFALDVILNLADLKKEERYNTIVIYPKDKGFQWPERAMDNLSFEADSEVVQQEALVIQESAAQPVEIMQAKDLLIQARTLEQKGDFEQTTVLLEKAFQLWPENTKIPVKLANVYLGRLQMNAKALHFAQLALEKDPTNTRAALYGAISSANMGHLAEAVDFFTQSVSDNPPLEDALLSYAAFSENNNQQEIAIKLLNTYAKHYGDNLISMVSKARIYDKLGEREKATQQYRALLSSGFQMRPDLKDYVVQRLATEVR